MRLLSVRPVLFTGLILVWFISGLFAQFHHPIHSFTPNPDPDLHSPTPYRLFTPIHAKDSLAVQFAPNAQFLTLDPAALTALWMQRPSTVTLLIPWHGESLLLELEKVEVVSEDFSILTERNADVLADYVPGAHYRGRINGETNPSIVALSVFEHELMGLIAHPEWGELVLGKLQGKDYPIHYILYSDEETTVRNPFACGAIDEGHGHSTPPQQAAPDVNGCVRVFLEADNELFLNKGSSVQNTVDYLLGVWNQVAALYANEQINTVVSQLFIWTTPDIYPTNSSASVLDAFRAFRTSFNGDLAHLVGLGGSNLGGIAYVDVLCQSAYNRAFSNIHASYSNVPVFSWTVEVITHEMGHNLGSRHTQWCGWSGGAIDGCVSPEGTCGAGPIPSNGGTIMSYCHLTSTGINFNNGFGPQPGNVVRSEVSAATCLAASCPVPVSCGAPSGISVNNITATGATVSWNAVGGATAYHLRYRAVGAAQWVSANNVASPYTLTNLPANDEIELTVQSVCGGVSSDFKFGVLFKTGSTGGGGGTSCGAPGSIGVTPSATSANSAWGAVTGANSYNISWKTSAASAWGATVNLTGTAYNITGLTASTSYNVRVQALCNGVGSAWTTTTFTTNASGGGACGAPGNLTATPASNSASASWNAVSGASSYLVSWKTASAASWGAPVSVAATNCTISGLTANTAYQARVLSVCANGVSAYTQVAFTTTGGGATCNAPTGLTATTTGNTATTTWTAAAGATSYNLQWKLASAANWNTAMNTVATNYQISGLTAGTVYQFRVQTVCANGASAYATASFTTQTGGGSSCGVPTGLIVSNISATSGVVSWSPVTGAMNYSLQVKRSAVANWSTFNGLPLTVVTMQGLLPSTSYDVRVKSNCSGGQSSAYTATYTFVTPANMLEDRILSEGTIIQWTENEPVVHIWPNPADEFLHVDLNDAGTAGFNCRLYDAQGRLAFDQYISGNQYALPLERISTGMYHVQIITDRGAVLPMRRVVIAHP